MELEPWDLKTAPGAVERWDLHNGTGQPESWDLDIAQAAVELHNKSCSGKMGPENCDLATTQGAVE